MESALFSAYALKIITKQEMDNVLQYISIQRDRMVMDGDVIVYAIANNVQTPKGLGEKSIHEVQALFPKETLDDAFAKKVGSESKVNHGSKVQKIAVELQAIFALVTEDIDLPAFQILAEARFKILLADILAEQKQELITRTV